MAKTVSIEVQLTSLNIAKKLDNDTLKIIGDKVYDGYDIDKKSRKDWEDRYQDYIKLAAQVKETKTFPWPNASNVKYPLLSIASLQFASRSYQHLLKGPQIVKGRVIGEDPEGKKKDSAVRIGQHMSYQLLEQMEEWEDDMDRLCLILPICGNAFKKIYRKPGSNISELVLPSDLVVNYHAKSILTAFRKSHIIYLHENDLEEKYRTEEFIKPKESLGEPTGAPEEGKDVSKESADDVHGIQKQADDPDAPHLFIEQHTFYDLDGDGYKEPCIITIHAATKQVLRIVARYDAEGVKVNLSSGKNELIRIDPIEYFVNYIFIPAPTSGVYGQGFGSLLGPLNSASNTIINQLVDSGTLSVLPSGFLSRNVRASAGNVPLKPGEWRPLNTTAEDLSKGVFPLPTKEPSAVLFQLLGLMLESGNRLASVSDLMSGDSPGQNQPHKTTSDLLQQGLQVFSSIYKRMHRSFKKELKLLKSLNRLYTHPQEYFIVLDSDEDVVGEIGKTDYQLDETDVIPTSAPELLTDAENLAKAEGLFAMVQMGTVNPVIATRRMLEAQGQEGINELMEMPPPQPDPELLLKERELAIREQEVIGNQQLQGFKNEAQAIRDMANSQLALAKAEAESNRVVIEKFEAEIKAVKAKAEEDTKRMEAELTAITEKYKTDNQPKKTENKSE